MILPVSAIIPTKDRETVLNRTLQSLFQQSHLPEKVIIVDASFTEEKSQRLRSFAWPAGVELVYVPAATQGAAHQRMQGIDISSSEFVFFMDDDIVFEAGCIERLYGGFSQSARVGGVNAMITNQLYTKPGFVTRSMYTMLSGRRLKTWAGMIIGPAWNLLPEDDPSLPEYVKCEWLNTTCTIYRRSALPSPVFPGVFTGYSLMEDVALSVVVSRNWDLLNARTARIFHDSQQSDYKKDHAKLAEMELVNRHYVMTEVLNRRGFSSHFKLFFFAAFGAFSGFISSKSFNLLIADLKGKIRALKQIL